MATYPEQALRAAIESQCADSTSGRGGDPHYRAMIERRERHALDAAYPLIRAEIKRELLDATRGCQGWVWERIRSFVHRTLADASAASSREHP